MSFPVTQYFEEVPKGFPDAERECVGGDVKQSPEDFEFLCVALFELKPIELRTVFVAGLFAGVLILQ